MPLPLKALYGSGRAAGKMAGNMGPDSGPTGIEEVADRVRQELNPSRPSALAQKQLKLVLTLQNLVSQNGRQIAESLEKLTSRRTSFAAGFLNAIAFHSGLKVLTRKTRRRWETPCGNPRTGLHHISGIPRSKVWVHHSVSVLLCLGLSLRL